MKKGNSELRQTRTKRVKTWLLSMAGKFSALRGITLLWLEAGLNLLSIGWYERRFSGKLYRSIDTMPIYNWNKIFQTGNLAFLYRDQSIFIDRKPIRSLFKLRIAAKIWRDMVSKHIEVFGISDDYMEIIELRTKIARMRLKSIINGDRGVRLFINIEQEKLAKLMAEKSSTSAEFGDIVIVVKKFMGYDVNVHKTSVYEFYSAVKMMAKQAEKNKRTGTI